MAVIKMRTLLSEETDKKQSNYLRIQNFTTIVMKSKTLTAAQKKDILVKARRGNYDEAVRDYDEILSANGIGRRDASK